MNIEAGEIRKSSTVNGTVVVFYDGEIWDGFSDEMREEAIDLYNDKYKHQNRLIIFGEYPVLLADKEDHVLYQTVLNEKQKCCKECGRPL